MGIQRAARYYYRSACVIADRMHGRTFGAAPLRRPRINLLRLEEELSEVHLRLVNVTIEHLPWQRFLKTYYKPGTLFYLDPPYYNTPYYNHNFELRDFQKLAEEALSDLKSKFILSINDHPDLRETFNDFTIDPVQLSYSTAKSVCTKALELLITK